MFMKDGWSKFYGEGGGNVSINVIYVVSVYIVLGY